MRIRITKRVIDLDDDLARELIKKGEAREVGVRRTAVITQPNRVHAVSPVETVVQRAPDIVEIERPVKKRLRASEGKITGKKDAQIIVDELEADEVEDSPFEEIEAKPKTTRKRASEVNEE